MGMDRIINKIKKVLNEAPEYGDEFENDGQVDPDKEFSYNKADYGAGIRPSKSADDTLTMPGEEPEGTKPSPKIVGTRQGSQFDKSTRRDRRIMRMADIEKSLGSDNKLASAIKQWNVTPEEKIQALEQRVFSKEFTQSLQGDDGQAAMQKLRDLYVQTLNNQNDIAKKMLAAFKQFNDAVTNENVKMAIGGNIGGNLSDDYLSIPLPEDVDMQEADDIIKSIVGSILSNAKGRHIVSNFISADTSVPEVPDITSPEEAQKTIDKLRSKAEQLTSRQNVHLRRIQQAQNVLDNMPADGDVSNIITKKHGVGQEPGKTVKSSLPKYLKLVNQEIDKALSSQNKMEEANRTGINAPNSDSDRIDRYFNQLLKRPAGKHAMEAFNKIVELKRKSELNAAIGTGILNKFKSLENFASKKKTTSQPSVTPEEVQEIMNVDDFNPRQDIIVIDDEYAKELGLMESSIKSYKKTLVEASDKKSEYTRKRSMTRKGMLKEVWKKQQENIRKTNIEQHREKDNSPDIHLGGLS